MSEKKIKHTPEGKLVVQAVRYEQARDMEEAHAQGYHDEIPREGCPECEDKRNRVGP
jgi:hypothetical protein